MPSTTSRSKSRSKSKSKAAPKAKAKARVSSKSGAKSKSSAGVRARSAAKTAAKPARKAAPKPAPRPSTAAPSAAPGAPAAAPRAARFKPGRFIWHDLMTTNADAAKAFYPALFGWTLDEMKMGPFTVWLFRQGDRRFGAIMPEPGLPSSHWIPYIAVEDVDAACKRIGELGGAVCVSPTDIPKLGRFAVVNDPQGGTFSPLARPADAVPPPDPAPGPLPHGTFCYDELLTTDPEGAAAFYRGLFGWQIEKLPMPDNPYWLVKDGGRDFAGMLTQPDPAAHRPFWCPYVAVDDVDAATQKAASLRAQVFVPPRDIPNVGRFSVIADPTGAVLALYRSAHR
jgi:predicted enzyme related to lactoylglutathione lyase